ncbi:MAG: cytochrome P450 [Candidatus Nephthysia bennettiae]|uniref:Cytochrome P450 n=1 Tax=Candidatus Nephthysia bennettiae TaxID=3127016 RepID=A0A934N2Z3_9BACT|nr:cytochrome P450 [Candidatus Dormibacteraeota bacterium]MBJ7614204.1 cytochrome P450 [Candidatus Dormibacteraeota bacterium]PZR99079.1 MAG: cytochrome P450 [Candidatus Dormibacteraeota bacterium]
MSLDGDATATTSSGSRARPVELASYEEVKEAFRQKDLKQALYDQAGVILQDALITLHGEEHRVRRRLENRLFRLDTLRGYELDVVRPSIAETIEPFMSRGWLDLVELSRRVTLNLSALIAGVDRPHESVEDTERLLDYVWKFSAGATVAHAVDKERVAAEAAEALEQYDREFFQASHARRAELVERFKRGEIEETELPRDILTLLLRDQDHLGLPLQTVRRETCGYLQAATGSTAMAVANTIDEIFGWLKSHPEDRPRLDGDLVFVQTCVHETIRLHPASPIASRRAMAPVRLKAGLDIPEGAAVVMDLMAANRDRAVFGSDAEEFRPGRPRPEGVPPWGVGFGGGAHSCIGQILDGGLDPAHMREDPAERNYGSVALVVQALFQHGVAPHPEREPARDTTSTRRQWGFYPVVLGHPAGVAS